MQKENDTKTGYYVYGPRFYEPVSGQWLSVDDAAGDKILAEVMNYRRTTETAAMVPSSGPQYGGASGDKVSNGNYGGAPELASEDDEEDKKKQKKETGKRDNAPKAKQQQTAAKRANRLQRNALQYNAMFFNHSTPVKRRSDRR